MENSNLILGEENKNGIIKIDGNKKEVEANANLIKLISSELTIYDNIYLCNNLNKTKKRSKNSSLLNANKFFGSALYAFNSKINIYGGEISNNIHEIFMDEKNKESQLPEILDNDFLYCVRGAGIYMNNCILNIYNGKICNNQGINNSSIFSNINSTTLKKKNATIHQNCQGIGIFASKNSEIYLHKGEISNNTAINNGKIDIRKSKNEKISKIFEIFSNIYGAGIYLINSKFVMNENFVIKNNFSELKSQIDIEKDCIIEKTINCAIRGGQLYLNNTICEINGGLIQNSNNKSSPNFSDKNSLIKEKKLEIDCLGGAINFINCKNIEINKLKIEKCNADRGGAILFNNCKGKIVDSIFENNFAKGFGGGIYIANVNSDFEFVNNKFLYNLTEEGSGGGIYAFGKLLIDGENTLISDNTAGTYGGGIMVKNNGIIKNGKISHNKALTQAGGGIRIDGTLKLINGKICKNWAKTKGGGINYDPSKKFDYNKENIDKIVYKNCANNAGNEIFPLIKK